MYCCMLLWVGRGILTKKVRENLEKVREFWNCIFVDTLIRFLLVAFVQFNFPHVAFYLPHCGCTENKGRSVPPGNTRRDCGCCDGTSAIER